MQQTFIWNHLITQIFQIGLSLKIRIFNNYSVKLFKKIFNEQKLEKVGKKCFSKAFKIWKRTKPHNLLIEYKKRNAFSHNWICKCDFFLSRRKYFPGFGQNQLNQIGIFSSRSNSLVLGIIYIRHAQHSARGPNVARKDFKFGARILKAWLFSFNRS